MSHKAVIAAAVLAVVSTPVAAQSLSGQLGIEYSAPTDGTDFGGTTYSGGLEYSINRQFAVGVDVSGYKLDNIDTSLSSATLHGIYHISDSATAGVFFGRDWIEDANSDVYGIEGGTEFMGGTVGGYIGRADDGTDTVNLFGLDGAYGLSNGFSVIAEYDRASEGDVSLSQAAIGAQYDLSAGPSVYAKLGNVSGEAGGTSADQTFITIGAEVAFGANRGTTFDQRSLFEILPGF
ncbi:porin [Yoonia sp. R2331]|uniref:porin n=1 Tax=Yoonia sp. R2331 TaxID=3237238 RepID=UPI0034E4212D